MLTVQEITDRLRSHYIGDGSLANASGKMRHRSEPAAAAFTADQHSSNVFQNTKFDGASAEPINVDEAPLRHQTVSKTASPAPDAHELPLSPASFCPPSKRHCRSLSIPSDNRRICLDECLSRHDLQRPVALHVPQSNSVVSATASLNYFRASPVPTRPTSAASSGFYDGGSSTSSLCCGWAAACDDTAASLGTQRRKAKCTGATPDDVTGQERMRPQTPGGAAIVCCGVYAAKSMPSMGAVGAFSAPSSPKHRRPARCRSQPCDLRQERCGGSLKRRRDDERPCLDFAKMTETAYERPFARFPRHKSFPVGMKQQQLQWSQHSASNGCGCSSHCSSEYSSVQVLQTIASSPLDSGCPTVPLSPPRTDLSSWRHSLKLANVALDESSNSSSSTDCEYADACDELFPVDICSDLDLDQIEQH